MRAMETGANLDALAQEALGRAEATRQLIATAESCTGGALAALLTSIEGCSSAFDRGFVVYTDEAKEDLLGIPAAAIERHGAVSREVAEAMAQRALERSAAAVAVSISGFTGGAGPGEENGLVHFALAGGGDLLLHRERHFGEVGRDEGRHLALREALELLLEGLGQAG
jgi:nicotinamide-nucleotide amidase